MENKKFQLEIGGRDLKVQIRKLAEKANGEVLVQYGDTMLLATCVMSNHEKEGAGFFPLSVNYEEKYYASGKIGGSRYMKREGRPSDEAVLNSRLIDRTIRPLFPKGLYREIQVIITCLSWDNENDPSILGLIAASIALSISDIPWAGPVSALRIGKNETGFLSNPANGENQELELELVLAGIKKDKDFLINMIECQGNEVDEETILKALDFGREELVKIIDFQNQIVKEVGKEKTKVESFKDEKVEKEVKSFLKDKLDKAIYAKSTSARENKVEELKDELSDFADKYEESKEKRLALDIFEKETDRIIHENILEKDLRPDERKLDEVRNIDCEVGIVPRSHGCGLFSRGETRTLTILTLGSPADQQLLEGMEIVGKKRFMHHYNFPPYSAGEVRPIRGPGRREIGHGMLAEKSLSSLLPSFDKFPYTIRIVSEVLSSNGSSSMASVSSSSLALMDAGVPIKRPVTGIAIGLIADDKNYKLLTDIQGPEDYHGDMDLKVAGTEKGITALQMDVKVSGITREILKEGLERGKRARLEILKKIKETIAEPRPELSPWAPRIYILQIKPDKIGDVIGPGGKIIRGMTEDYDVSIDIEEDGRIFVTSEKEENAKKVLSLIKNITREIKPGEVFEGEIKKVVDFGVFVEVLPGREGLLHASKIRNKKYKVGESVSVKIAGIDPQGKIDLLLNKVFRK